MTVLILDNASIVFSGSLKRSGANEVKLKDNRSVILNKFVLPQGKTENPLLITHC
ncbi:MAG: hypothetical protein J6U05_08560 [Neisseriaceae bacterium]|nr:hypothetical protein [Neisseriaceae bacterium]MBO7554978.1 hypothetical protein [Neisseriaceae bacterium]MBQ5429229.1 hypothetical protein [Neisseriaceae bacterium]